MTDRILTPEVYGDFGLFMEQMGLRPKPKPTPQQAEPVRQATNNDWYKQGKECPF
jgi:hypothetical protein